VWYNDSSYLNGIKTKNSGKMVLGMVTSQLTRKLYIPAFVYWKCLTPHSFHTYLWCVTQLTNDGAMFAFDNTYCAWLVPSSTTWDQTLKLCRVVGSSKQDRQCTYNVTLRSVCVPIVATETQQCASTVQLHVCQQYKNTECCTTMSLSRI
jgi:hypothetical protein